MSLRQKEFIMSTMDYEKKAGGNVDVDSASNTSPSEDHVGQVYEYAGEPASAHRGELTRAFKSRHMLMICLGGCIGSGLLISTGKALRYGSYPGMFIGYGLICTMALATIHVLSEATCLFPTSGSFVDHAARFVDPALGFAIGFCEWFGWMTVVAAEAAVVRVIVTYWTEAIPTWACMTIYLIITYGIHVFPSWVFAEFEFGTGFVKVLMMIGLILTSLAIIGGAGPTGSKDHAANYTTLPAFPNGFKGVASCFILAAWATGGQEIMGISAGESRFPRWDMPRSCNTLVGRIVVFYMLSIVMITILVPHNDPLLLGTSTVAASPFVISMTKSGIRVLPDIVNVIILIGLCAIGSESLFIASRVMTAMARMRMMPQILGRVDKKGRPYVSLTVTALCATACTYINCANTGAIIFTWFSSISSTVYFLAWMTISVTNWQMHRAIKAQNDPAWQLKWAFQNKWYPTASIYLFTTSFFVLFATGYVALYPIGGEKSIQNFFQTFLAPPLFVFLYLAYKVVFRTKFVKPSEADLVSGRRTLTEENLAFLDAYAELPLYKRILSYVTISGDAGIVMRGKVQTEEDV